MEKWVASLLIVLLLMGCGKKQDKVVGDSSSMPVATGRQLFEPEMVAIPSGTFIIGCKLGRDDVEGGCAYLEKPAHEVSISAFHLAKTEVTVAQFSAFVEATGYKTSAETAGSCLSLTDNGNWDDFKGYLWRQLGFKQGDDHPVACISWNDTQAYLKWLNQATGKHYRLPTEAEWEYAARGGRESAYSWGNETGKGSANCAHEFCGDKFEYTSPVSSFAANGYGLYDMGGNVWEWCQDDYGIYAAEAQQDPLGKKIGSIGSFRILRGGSWGEMLWSMRSAYRSNGTPDYRSSDAGFRVAND